jgi:uncharacterized protein YbjQ (UPF0145 family)
MVPVLRNQEALIMVRHLTLRTVAQAAAIAATLGAGLLWFVRVEVGVETRADHDAIVRHEERLKEVEESIKRLQRQARSATPRAVIGMHFDEEDVK